VVVGGGIRVGVGTGAGVKVFQVCQITVAGGGTNVLAKAEHADSRLLEIGGCGIR